MQRRYAEGRSPRQEPADQQEQHHEDPSPSESAASVSSVGHPVSDRREPPRGTFKVVCPQHGRVRIVRRAALHLFDEPWFTCPVHHAEYWRARRQGVAT